MKKRFKLTALLLFVQLTTVCAQTSASSDHSTGTGEIWELIASLNPGLTFHNPRFVIGADLQLERHLTDLLGLTFSTGFTRVSNRTVSVTFTFAPPNPPVTFDYSTDQNLIPLKLGVKLYPVQKLYLAGAVGIAIDINGNSNTVSSASAGIQMSRRFDLGLKYERYENSFSSSNQIALRLGYQIF